MLSGPSSIILPSSNPFTPSKLEGKKEREKKGGWVNAKIARVKKVAQNLAKNRVIRKISPLFAKISLFWENLKMPSQATLPTFQAHPRYKPADVHITFQCANRTNFSREFTKLPIFALFCAFCVFLKSLTKNLPRWKIRCDTKIMKNEKK